VRDNVEDVWGAAPMWIRLEHRRLRFPVPSVYLPVATEDRAVLLTAGFVSVRHRLQEMRFPMSGHLAVDVMSEPDAMILLVFNRSLGSATASGTTASTVAVRPDLQLRGVYDVPADETWQNEAYAARRVLLVAGPVPPEKVSHEELLRHRDVTLVGATVAVLA
jgi:hypothetical protein